MEAMIKIQLLLMIQNHEEDNERNKHNNVQQELVLTCNCSLLVKNNFLHPIASANERSSSVTVDSLCW